MIRRLNGLGSFFHNAQSQPKESYRQHNTSNNKSGRAKAVKGHKNADIIVCVQFMQFPVIFLRPTREESMETETNKGSKVNTLHDYIKREKRALRSDNDSILFNVCHRAEFEIEGNDLNNFFPPPCECYLLNSQNITLAHWSCPCPLITLRQDSKHTKFEEKHNFYDYDDDDDDDNTNRNKLKTRHPNSIFINAKLSRPIYANYAMRRMNNGNYNDSDTTPNNKFSVNHRLKKFSSECAFVGYAEMACRVVVVGYARIPRNVTPYQENGCKKIKCSSAVCSNTVNQEKSSAEITENLTCKEQIEKPYVIRVFIDGDERASRKMKSKYERNEFTVSSKSNKKADCNTEKSSIEEINSVKSAKQKEQQPSNSNLNQKERFQENRCHSHKKSENHSLTEAVKQVQKHSNSVVCPTDAPANTLYYVVQYNIIYQLRSVCELVKKLVTQHRVLPIVSCVNKETETQCKLIDRHMKEIIRLTNIVMQEFNSANWTNLLHNAHVNKNNVHDTNVNMEYLKLTSNNICESNKSVSLFINNEQKNFKVDKNGFHEKQIADGTYVNKDNKQDEENHSHAVAVELGSSEMKEHTYRLNDITEEYNDSNTRLRKNLEERKRKECLASKYTADWSKLESLPIVEFLRYSVWYQLESILFSLEMFVSEKGKLLLLSLLEIEELPTKLAVFTTSLEKECQQFVMRVNILLQLIANKHDTQHIDTNAISKTETKLTQCEDKSNTHLVVQRTHNKKDSSNVFQQKVDVDKRNSKLENKLATVQSMHSIPTHSKFTLPVYSESLNEQEQKENVTRRLSKESSIPIKEPLERDKQSNLHENKHFDEDASTSSVSTEPTIKEETELLLSSSTSSESLASTQNTSTSTSSPSVIHERSTDTKTAYDTDSFESESESNSSSDSDYVKENEDSGFKDDDSKVAINTISQNTAPELLTLHLSTVPLSLPIPTLPASYNILREELQKTKKQHNIIT